MSSGQSFFPGTWRRSRRKHRERSRRQEGQQEDVLNPTLGVEILSTDFRGAMQKNVRATLLLLAVMITISMIVGYSFGWGLEVMTYNHPALRAVDTSDAAVWYVIYLTR